MERAQINRRKNRSSDVQVALSFQLAATARRAKFTALVLADELGLVVAAVGHKPTGEKMAALAPMLTARTRTFHGSMKTSTGPVRVSIAPVSMEGVRLYLCAAEGEAAEITRELFTGGLGVTRILA